MDSNIALPLYIVGVHKHYVKTCNCTSVKHEYHAHNSSNATCVRNNAKNLHWRLRASWSNALVLTPLSVINILLVLTATLVTTYRPHLTIFPPEAKTPLFATTQWSRLSTCCLRCCGSGHTGRNFWYKILCLCSFLPNRNTSDRKLGNLNVNLQGLSQRPQFVGSFLRDSECYVL